MDDSIPDPLQGEFCGGVILDSTHVLTAAHCIYDANRPSATIPPASVRVISGKVSLDQGSQELVVKDIIIHESWRNGATHLPLDSDVALLVLANPLTFDTNTRPANLPATDPMGSAKVELRVAGWGVTDITKPLDRSRVLR